MLKREMREIKRAFMGPRVTNEGTQKYWGKKDLHEACSKELERMNIEEKLKFLVDRGVIDCDDREVSSVK
jgi:hypothetical protein